MDIILKLVGQVLEIKQKFLTIDSLEGLKGNRILNANSSVNFRMEIMERLNFLKNKIR